MAFRSSGLIFYIMSNTQLTPEEAIIIFVIMVFAYLVSITVHEFSHAFVAYKFGDDTAKLKGRLTLNPFKHITLMSFLSFLILGISWANPVPVNPVKFKKYRTGIRCVSVAGVVSNFLLGLFCAIIYAILMATVGTPNLIMEYIYIVLIYFMVVNSCLALFNILPVYPLDGFNFVTSFMRGDNKFISYNMKNGWRILMLVILGCVLVEWLFDVYLLSDYLSLLYNFIYLPIMGLGG